ncbi:MAG: dihydrolipoyl dehydrogenase [Acidimicrobiia bacterium]|nr:dihydrolipoyl dehydrogenase [Acidimicrobiia bacterium]
MTDRPTAIPASTQVLIIGGGPGGYVAGIRASQLGLDVTVVDPEPLGGTCLNVGCIPSKALIHAADEFAAATARAVDAGGSPQLGISVTGVGLDLAATMTWKDDIVSRLNAGVAGLLTRAGATIVPGRARLSDGKTAEIVTVDGRTATMAADHVVIATGSVPIELPHIPFGPTEFGAVISSTEALALQEVPRRLVVVGGGYIGLELGQAYAKLGSRVTVVEAEERVLSIYDKRLTMPLTRSLKALGVELLTGSKAAGLAPDGLVIDTGVGGQEDRAASDSRRRTLVADQVLVTVGRRARTDGWGLANIGLRMNGRFVAIDARGHTSMKDVWAIGDVTGEPMLAHRAMKQGEVVAEAIAGLPTAFDQRAIPAIVFTDPEIVSVGLGPDQAAAELAALGTAVVEGRFNVAANGRSMTLRPDQGGSPVDAGFVRVLARADNHLVVGIQAVGRGVAELAAAFGLAIEMGARLEDIADTVHAHPTVGEGLAEASAAALGRAVHG